MNKKYIVRLSNEERACWQVIKTLKAIWPDKTNARQRGFEWQFRVSDARRRLTRLRHKLRI